MGLIEWFRRRGGGAVDRAPLSGLRMPFTLADQIEILRAFGVELRPGLDLEALTRAVAVDIAEGDLDYRGTPLPRPPHRQVAFWWLLFETVGRKHCVQGRHRLHTPGPPDGPRGAAAAEGFADSLRSTAARLCADTGADLPAIEVRGMEGPAGRSAGTVRLGRREVPWTGNRFAFEKVYAGPLAEACSSSEHAVVVLDEHVRTGIGGVVDVQVVRRDTVEEFIEYLGTFPAWGGLAAKAVHDARVLRANDLEVPADHPSRHLEQFLAPHRMTVGLPPAEEIRPWRPEDPPTERDKLILAQDRVVARYREAVGSRDRSAAMSPEEKVRLLAEAGIPLREGADDAELAEQLRAESWDHVLSATIPDPSDEREDVSAFSFVFPVPDSPLDDPRTGWPAVVEDLGDHLGRTSALDITADLDEEGNGHLRLTLAGQSHEVPVEGMGKHLDLMALGEVAELLAPADRTRLDVGDVWLWPRADSADRLREVMRAG